MPPKTAVPGPRFHVLGAKAAYTKRGLDGREAALAEGVRPGDPVYGLEPENRHGTLVTGGERRLARPVRRAYPEFYPLLADALNGGAASAGGTGGSPCCC